MKAAPAMESEHSERHAGSVQPSAEDSGFASHRRYARVALCPVPSWHNLVSGPTLQLAPVAFDEMPSPLTVARGRGRRRTVAQLPPNPYNRAFRRPNPRAGIMPSLHPALRVLEFSPPLLMYPALRRKEMRDRGSASFASGESCS